jgi:hypothetical protein
MGATVFDKESQQNKPANINDAVTYLNEFLAYDGYEIVPHGKGYDVVDKTRGDRQRGKPECLSRTARGSDFTIFAIHSATGW